MSFLVLNALDNVCVVAHLKVIHLTTLLDEGGGKRNKRRYMPQCLLVAYLCMRGHSEQITSFSSNVTLLVDASSGRDYY